MYYVWQLKTQRINCEVDWSDDDVPMKKIANGYIPYKNDTYSLVWFFNTKFDAITARAQLRARPCNAGMRFQLKETDMEQMESNSSLLSL